MEPYTDAPPPPVSEPLPEQVSLRKRFRLVVELILLLVLMGIILALISNKIQLEEVISESMMPTLQVGDVIMTDANAFPKRYDVVCFKDPDKGSEDKLVKRVMGLPGDTILIQNGILYVNGQEEYSRAIEDNQSKWDQDNRLRVPQGRIYVMGDNRNNSQDSRVFGPVPSANLTGVVRLIVWPPRRWGRLQALH